MAIPTRTLAPALLGALLAAACGGEPDETEAGFTALEDPAPTLEPAEPDGPDGPDEPALLDPAGAWTDEHQAALDELLGIARLELTVPEGFHLAPGENHPALPYEARLVADDGGLEVRLSIRPLSTIEIDYQDAHSSAPEPNHSFGMFYRAIMERLTPTGIGTEQELTHEACLPYHATWGMVATLDLRPASFPDHEEALLLTIHREYAADAYLLYLPDDMKAQKTRILETLQVLTFVPPPGPSAPEESTTEEL